MYVIGNAWPEYRVSCFEHALSQCPNVHHVFVPALSFLNVEGMRSLAPLVINPFSIDKSSL